MYQKQIYLFKHIGMCGKIYQTHAGGVFTVRKFLVILLVIIISGMILAGIVDEIKKRGYLIVGTEATFPPFEFVDEKTKEIVGFDIDIAREIAKALGVKLKVEDIAFDGLIPSLLTKKIDLIAAAMTITPERAKVVSFSDPYFTAGQVIVVRKDSFMPKTFDELVGKKVAVQLGTTGDLEVSKVEGIEVVRFTRYTEAFLELQNGRVDAVVLDFAPAQAYVKMNPGLVISSGILSQEEYGIAVRKEDKDLLEVVNTVLRNLKKSPYDILVEKWFSK